MKKILTLIVIAIIIATSAYAEVQPYGGHNELWFYEFVDTAVFTEIIIVNGKASQEVWFANSWHIVGECNEDCALKPEIAETMLVRVYNQKGLIIDTRTLYNNDEGEQTLWDLIYSIANEEL